MNYPIVKMLNEKNVGNQSHFMRREYIKDVLGVWESGNKILKPGKTDLVLKLVEQIIPFLE